MYYGPEFDGPVLDQWDYHSRVLSFIRPGKPNENEYIEIFNGEFRDECLKPTRTKLGIRSLPPYKRTRVR